MKFIRRYKKPAFKSRKEHLNLIKIYDVYCFFCIYHNLRWSQFNCKSTVIKNCCCLLKVLMNLY